MRWCGCFIRCKNFPLKRPGRGIALMGFYTGRWFEASGEGAAELACVSLLKSDPNLANASGQATKR